jgi:hypothetical protein
MAPGKGLVLLARFIRALPCDVDHKALCTQVVSETQLPLESVYAMGGAPPMA